MAEKIWTLMCTWAEPNLVRRNQFQFENQSQTRKVRLQYHKILTIAHKQKFQRIAIQLKTEQQWKIFSTFEDTGLERV